MNQEMEIIGSKGRVFVDQQDRGLRSCITDNGTRTHNPHFQAEVPRRGTQGSTSCIGYCKDSLVAGLDAASRVKLGLATREALAGTYADAESAVPLVAIIEAAARVADANQRYLAGGKGTPVSAVLTADSFGIIDPNNG